SEELPDPDGEPQQVRLFGENFVAFRDTNGRVGFLDENCPHRGASLAYARNEECGLRCIYHGWKVDTDGRVVDMPTEPPSSTFRDRLRHPAYPVREAGDVIWVYLGPRELEPVFPAWEWTHAPPERRGASKIFQDCNYAQGVEGTIDSAHSDYLHSSDIRGRPNDHAPRLEAVDTPYGFNYAAIRAPDIDANVYKYVRITLFVAPFFAFIPPFRQGRLASDTEAAGEVVVQQAFVPIDDEHNWFFTFAYNRKGPLPTYWRKHASEFGIQGGHVGRPVRNRANKHQQDRAAMPAGNWSGVVGVNPQDFAVAESMGPILNRSREHLGATDVAVIRFRQRMLEAARTQSPPGLDAKIAYDRLASEELLIPIAQPWEEISTSVDVLR
ncbi:MAG: aromatic ring-hydroxylating dioxygenase subunit alpha, partial [Chloroflexi bacterium]|nr:aromatic ring-hydroxylating dioxygenase subunit alpha [Chloroflexota bacterium]